MMYDQAADESPDTRKLRERAALWTPKAQKQYAHLTSMDDQTQRSVRLEIGYLQQAKEAHDTFTAKGN